MENKTKYLNVYNKITREITNYFDGNKEIEEYMNELEKSDEINKITSGIKFNREINSDESVRDLFIKKKVKIFSSKSSNTKELATILFPKLSLKKLLNKQKEDFTEKIWIMIQAIYCLSEYIDKNSDNVSESTEELYKLIENTPLLTKLFTEDIENSDDEEDDEDDDEEPDMSKMIKTVSEMLGSNNESGNEFVKDVLMTFEESMGNQENNKNPFASIMDASKNIAEKYQDKIENGDLDITDMYNNIQKNMKIPGMPNFNFENKSDEEIKHIIDENFSTGDVDVGEMKKDDNTPQLHNFLKTMKGFGGGDVEGFGELFELASSLGNPDQENSEELIEKFHKFMETKMGVDPEKIKDIHNKIKQKEENGEEIDPQELVKNIMENSNMENMFGNIVNEEKKNSSENNEETN